MNKSLNVFLSVLLCVVLCVGVLTSLYTTDDSASQHYQTEYTSSIPAGTGTPALSFGTSANGNDLAVPMSSRRSSREQYLQPSWRSTGVADLQVFSRSANSTGMLSLPSLQGGDGGRLLTYTSSSQTMKSFGGGSNTAGVSMSGGVVSATTQSPIANNQLSLQRVGTSLSSSSISLPLRDGQGAGYNSLLAYSPEDILSSSNGMRAIGGRRNAAPGVERMYWEWLTSYWGEEEDLKGWAYYQGENTITYDELYALFLRMTEDSPMFNTEEAWISFYNWFMGNMDGDGLCSRPAGKCILTNYFNRVGNIDIQRRTTTERIISNACNAIRYCNACKAGAIRERTISNACNAVGGTIINNTHRNYHIAGVFIGVSTV